MLIEIEADKQMDVKKSGCLTRLTTLTRDYCVECMQLIRSIERTARCTWCGGVVHWRCGRGCRSCWRYSCLSCIGDHYCLRRPRPQGRGVDHSVFHHSPMEAAEGLPEPSTRAYCMLQNEASNVLEAAALQDIPQRRCHVCDLLMLEAVC